MVDFMGNLLLSMGRSRDKIMAAPSYTRMRSGNPHRKVPLRNTRLEYDAGLVTVRLYDTPIVVAASDWLEFWPGSHPTLTTVRRMTKLWKIARGGDGVGGPLPHGYFTHKRWEYIIASLYDRAEAHRVGDRPYWHTTDRGVYVLDHDHRLRIHHDGGIVGTELRKVDPRMWCRWKGIKKYVHPREWCDAWRIEGDERQRIMAAALRRRIKG